MKRFLCTVCQKQKRVRRLPSNVDSDTRVGRCGWHGASSHRSYLQFQRSKGHQASKGVIITSKASKSQTPRPSTSFKASKSRKSRRNSDAA